MGNKANRGRKRKLFKFNIKNLMNRKASASDTIDDDVTTEESPARPAEVDVVSFLGPIPEFKTEHDISSDQMTPIADNIKQEADAEDPLFDVKSPTTSDHSSIQFLHIEPIKDEIKAEVESDPNSNENVIINDDDNKWIEFRNMCRLCLTKEATTWIDIFSSKPYLNVVDITPSNIVECIEQFTTVEVSKDDHLPDKLCVNCFQSLRFVHKFRQQSLRSQNAINLKANAISKSICQENQQDKVFVNGVGLRPIKRLVKAIHPKPIRKPVPNPNKQLTFEEACKQEMEREKFRDVQCEICGQVFEKYKQLQYHLNRHNGVRPFACTVPYCDKSFYSPQNLKHHIHNIHAADPKYKCDMCEKTYNKAEKLNIHRTVHFPPTIPCTICGKLLRNPSSVRKHKASHSERLFKCDDCGKSFQNAYTLRVHQRIHTNEKPFICCKCGEAFAHKCVLKAHTEKNHPD